MRLRLKDRAKTSRYLKEYLELGIFGAEETTSYEAPEGSTGVEYLELETLEVLLSDQAKPLTVKKATKEFLSPDRDLPSNTRRAFTSDLRRFTEVFGERLCTR